MIGGEHCIERNDIRSATPAVHLGLNAGPESMDGCFEVPVHCGETRLRSEIGKLDDSLVSKHDAIRLNDSGDATSGLKFSADIFDGRLESESTPHELEAECDADAGANLKRIEMDECLRTLTENGALLEFEHLCTRSVTGSTNRSASAFGGGLAVARETRLESSVDEESRDAASI